MISQEEFENIIRDDNTEQLRKLFSNNQIDGSTILNEANTWPLLSLAAFYGSEECLLFLINYIKVTYFNNISEILTHINVTNVYKNAPIHYAVKNNRINCVSVLLEAGADPNLPKSNNFEFYETPLHIACGNNNLDILKLLIQYGGKFNIRSRLGHTPLHVALMHNAFQCAKYLYSIGADIHDKSIEDYTPLHFAQFATTNDETECSEWLLSHDVEINAQATNGETPLFVAAHNCHAQGCALLLAHGADINIPNNYNGNTPLHDVIDQLNLAWYNIELLTLDDVNCVDRYYDDVKHAYETICVLLDHHPDLEAKNHDGDTPLSLAAKKGVADIIEPLIQDRTASKAWLEKLELARESYKEDIPNDE